MGFFRMDNGPSKGTEAVEELTHRRNNRRQRCHVVPQGLAKSPRFEKIALHIDNHERQAMHGEFIGKRGGGNGRHGHLLCVLTSDPCVWSSQLCRCLFPLPLASPPPHPLVSQCAAIWCPMMATSAIWIGVS
jgi:hypothetical protein